MREQESNKQSNGSEVRMDNKVLIQGYEVNKKKRGSAVGEIDSKPLELLSKYLPNVEPSFATMIGLLGQGVEDILVRDMTLESNEGLGEDYKAVMMTNNLWLVGKGRIGECCTVWILPKGKRRFVHMVYDLNLYEGYEMGIGLVARAALFADVWKMPLHLYGWSPVDFKDTWKYLEFADTEGVAENFRIEFGDDVVVEYVEDAENIGLFDKNEGMKFLSESRIGYQITKHKKFVKSFGEKDGLKKYEDAKKRLLS